MLRLLVLCLVALVAVSWASEGASCSSDTGCNTDFACCNNRCTTLQQCINNDEFNCNDDNEECVPGFVCCDGVCRNENEYPLPNAANECNAGYIQCRGYCFTNTSLESENFCGAEGSEAGDNLFCLPAGANATVDTPDGFEYQACGSGFVCINLFTVETGEGYPGVCATASEAARFSESTCLVESLTHTLRNGGPVLVRSKDTAKLHRNSHDLNTAIFVPTTFAIFLTALFTACILSAK